MPRITLLAPVLACLAVVAPKAQDTTSRPGVRVFGGVLASGKPGVLVLPMASPTGDSTRAILERDFGFGHRINVVALEASAVPPFAAASPNYPLFSRLGAHVLLQVVPIAGGIRVLAHDPARAQVVLTRDYRLLGEAYSPDWRLSLHVVADDLEQAITGVRGISATRILYTSDKRVWQIDFDGANPIALTGPVGAMSPAWHPRGTHIVYHSMGDAEHQIILREAGGATRALKLGSGALLSTPVFAPDGTTLAYSLGREAGVDLYAINVFGAEPAKRITVGRGASSTSPSFSPDGRQIAFASDRAGATNVYISDADGLNVEALIPAFGDGSYRSNPDWSPDGRLIAFQTMDGGRFQVMTIGVRDRSIRKLTSTGVNEDPSWAPDSRHLVLTSTRGGTRQIWVVDAESGEFRQLTHAPSGARSAAWSRSLSVR